MCPFVKDTFRITWFLYKDTMASPDVKRTLVIALLTLVTTPVPTPCQNPHMSESTLADAIARERDLAEFRAFVERSRWRFAKTYVESYPHEYTLDRWGATDALCGAVQCIERWGVVELFWGAQRKYLHVDERKYWHMGDAASAMYTERWSDRGLTLADGHWLTRQTIEPLDAGRI